MSFNGTEHFPGREIIQYLQGIGASFGENINAATGIEKTTYKISDIPVSRTSVVDSCIMILCDFSHYIINNPVDIDAERKVILEERRSRMNSQWRMQSKGQELLYRGTRYAACSLIGSEENLRSFPPEALVDFYRTWYRPDLQAVVVVGDIDPDYVEKTIEKTFSGISMPQDPKPREAIEIPSNREPIVGVITDREALGTSIEVIWKRRPVPRDERNTSTALEKELSESIITLVMAERLQGIVSDQDSAPFVNASLSFGDLTESCNALVGGVMARDGKALPALEGFMEEMERMKRYGFTSEEISRARTNLLSAARSNLESSSTRKNSEIVEDCLAHFFDAECFPSPKDLSDAVTRCLGRLTDQRVNQEAASCITDTNMVVLYKAPEKAGLTHPSEEDILRVVLDARARQVAPPSTDSLPDRFVDPSTIRKGKIRKTRSYLYGSKIWTLSNGMNVVLMPTDREKDMVRIELVKKGGLSLIPTEDLDSFEENIFSLFLQNQGAGKFSAVQGSKMLSGKEVSVAPFMGSHTHGIEAACSRKDIYTALELVYLEFTEPRFDESEYSQGIQTIRTMLPNVINQPYFVLERALAKTAYGSSPRHTMLSEEVLDRASLQTVERNWRRIFDGVNGATVFIVGDFDIKEIRPLVETFLASLPKGGEPSQWKDNKDGIASGSATEEATLSMIDPIVTVYEIYKLDTGYTPKKEAALSALEFILNTLYISTMRQKIGGTYSATVASLVFKGAFRTGRAPGVVQLQAVALRDSPESRIRGFQGNCSAGPYRRGVLPCHEKHKKEASRIQKHRIILDVVPEGLGIPWRRPRHGP